MYSQFSPTEYRVEKASLKWLVEIIFWLVEGINKIIIFHLYIYTVCSIANQTKLFYCNNIHKTFSKKRNIPKTAQSKILNMLIMQWLTRFTPHTCLNFYQSLEISLKQQRFLNIFYFTNRYWLFIEWALTWNCVQVFTNQLIQLYDRLKKLLNNQ